MNMPKLKKVAGGWLAMSDAPGDKWAVLASTQEDALHSFYVKLEKYKEIDARPLNVSVASHNPEEYAQ